MPRDTSLCRRCGYPVVETIPEGVKGSARDAYHWRMCASKRDWPAWMTVRNTERKERRAEVRAIVSRPAETLGERGTRIAQELAAMEAALGGAVVAVVEPVIVDTPAIVAKRAEMDAELAAFEEMGDNLPMLGEAPIALGTSSSQAAEFICADDGKTFTSAHGLKVHQGRAHG